MSLQLREGTDVRCAAFVAWPRKAVGLIHEQLRRHWRRAGDHAIILPDFDGHVGSDGMHPAKRRHVVIVRRLELQDTAYLFQGIDEFKPIR